MKKYTGDFLREGGKWLGDLRTRIQTMFRNGDDVTWGSEDRVSHIPTVRELEELGSYAVSGYHEEVVEPLVKILEECEKRLTDMEKPNTLFNKIDDDRLLDRVCYTLRKKPRWMVQHERSKQ